MRIPDTLLWPGPVYCEPCGLAEQARAAEEELNRALARAEIPPIFRDFHLDRQVAQEPGESREAFMRRVRARKGMLGVATENRPLLGQLQAWLEAPDRAPWLWLRGPQGSGKTLLMCCLGRALLEQGMEACFLTEQALFRGLAPDRAGREARGRWFPAVEECEVLLLDDCNPLAHQADPPRPWMVRAMIGLINSRYNRRRTTIFTSRCGLLEYGGCWRFGSAPEADAGVGGRLFELCGGEELELADLDWRTGWVADVET